MCPGDGSSDPVGADLRVCPFLMRNLQRPETKKSARAAGLTSFSNSAKKQS